MSCGFNYTIPIGEVTAYSYDTSTKTLVIQGTNLATSVSDIRYVEFAHSKCTVSETSNAAT